MTTFFYSRGVTPPVGVTPYIIVDNKKLSPIGRTTAVGCATDDSETRCEPDFGIVDRVTISRAAREKSKLMHAHACDESTVNRGESHALSLPKRSLLTYSPTPGD